MAETVVRDIIILGFRQSFYTKITRGQRKADGTPGEILKTDENIPEYWVKYTNRGSPQSMATEERLRHMDPDNMVLPDGADGGEKLAFLNHRWNQIKPAFDAWISGQQLPEYGIPVGAWPALDDAQRKAFISMGIKSIEDIRDLSENTIGKIRLPNVRDLKKLAGLYLEGIGVAASAEREKVRDDKITALEEQLAAAMELLEEQAKINAESSGGKRPAKDKEAA